MINTDKSDKSVNNSDMSGLSSDSEIETNSQKSDGRNYSPKTSVGKMLNMDQMNSFSTEKKRDEHFILPKNKDQQRKTLFEVLHKENAAFIPEAMPIIRRISLLHPKEPELYHKLRKGNAIKKVIQEEDYQELCNHDEGVENWKCKSCNANISKFNICFDDTQGRVSTYSKILYENQFLEDFKVDFIS